MLTSLNEQQRKTLTETGVVYPPSEYVDNPFPITMKLIEEGNERLLLHSPIELDCPVRLIQGMDDPDVPWVTSLQLAEQLTSVDVDVRLIKGGGHRLSEQAHLKVITNTICDLLQERV